MPTAVLNPVRNVERLQRFVVDFAAVRDGGVGACHARAAMLEELISDDDWLPDEYAQSDPVGCRQYLLHRDRADRFSVVSLVRAPGQASPIHDHRVWRMVGILRGAELVQPYSRLADGSLAMSRQAFRLEPGDIEVFRPDLGDIHSVANACHDRASISIHVHGTEIGTFEQAHLHNLTQQGDLPWA